jgi:hypothetical protein
MGCVESMDGETGVFHANGNQYSERNTPIENEGAT